MHLITTLTLTELLGKTSLNLPLLTMGHSAYGRINRPYSRCHMVSQGGKRGKKIANAINCG